jgi:hypothetical protein
MARKLRIAVSVFFGVLTVVLCVLWVRSYWWADYFLQHKTCSFWMSAATHRGQMLILVGESQASIRSAWSSLPAQGVGPMLGGGGCGGFKVELQSSASPSQLNRFGVRFPIWFAVAMAITASYLPWYAWRFTIRTLLIATTLFAIVLGLGVWAAS